MYSNTALLLFDLYNKQTNYLNAYKETRLRLLQYEKVLREIGFRPVAYSSVDYYEEQIRFFEKNKPKNWKKIIDKYQ